MCAAQSQGSSCFNPPRLGPSSRCLVPPLHRRAVLLCCAACPSLQQWAAAVPGFSLAALALGQQQQQQQLPLQQQAAEGPAIGGSSSRDEQVGWHLQAHAALWILLLEPQQAQQPLLGMLEAACREPQQEVRLPPAAAAALAVQLHLQQQQHWFLPSSQARSIVHTSAGWLAGGPPAPARSPSGAGGARAATAAADGCSARSGAAARPLAGGCAPGAGAAQ